MLKDILNKLVDDCAGCVCIEYPENECPCSKTKVQAEALLKQSFKDAVPKEREERGYLARDVRWHEDNGFNKCIKIIKEKIDAI